jgi:hypothetical protein
MNRRSSFFDSAHHLNQDGINLYVDALKLERQLDLPEDVRAHVAECQICKQQILDLTILLRDVSFPREAHPFFDREHTVQRTAFSSSFRVAASVALLIGASAIVAYLVMRHPEQQVTQRTPPIPNVDTARAAKTPLTSPPERYAANFAESPTLERFVDRSFRSGDIIIQSPTVGEIMRDSLVFDWEAQIAPPFVLRIVNNREDPVSRHTVTGSHYVLARRFTPGLYYWKLESNDQLVYVGKFLVR